MQALISTIMLLGESHRKRSNQKMLRGLWSLSTLIMESSQRTKTFWTIHILSRPLLSQLALETYTESMITTIWWKCSSYQTNLNWQANLLIDTVNIIDLFALDRDSVLSGRTWDCSLIACGSLIEAADKIMKGEATNAFCAVRPPGHHAGVFGRTK